MKFATAILIQTLLGLLLMWGMIQAVPRRETGLIEISISGLLNIFPAPGRMVGEADELEPGRWPDTREDIENQLAALVHPTFQRDTPREWLAQYPRYMKALRTRVSSAT